MFLEVRFMKINVSTLLKVAKAASIFRQEHAISR